MRRVSWVSHDERSLSDPLEMQPYREIWLCFSMMASAKQIPAQKWWIYLPVGWLAALSDNRTLTSRCSSFSLSLSLNQIRISDLETHQKSLTEMKLDFTQKWSRFISFPNWPIGHRHVIWASHLACNSYKIVCGHFTLWEVEKRFWKFLHQKFFTGLSLLGSKRTKKWWSTWRAVFFEDSLQFNGNKRGWPALLSGLRCAP